MLSPSLSCARVHKASAVDVRPDAVAANFVGSLDALSACFRWACRPASLLMGARPDALVLLDPFCAACSGCWGPSFIAAAI